LPVVSEIWDCGNEERSPHSPSFAETRQPNFAMNILLAIDPSPASEVALEHLLACPQSAGTNVEVLTVIAPKYLKGRAEVVEELRRRETYLVQRAAEKLRSAGLNATPVIMTGEPKENIVARAAQGGADLALIGAHGESGLPRFLMGSVANAVLRFAPCSVRVVRSAPERGGLHGMKILLATDGSDASALAAQSIAKRPWPPGTRIRILSVVDFPAPPGVAPNMGENVAEAAILASKKILADVEVETPDVPRRGRPKEVILEEAQDWGADLIVLGPHGPSGISRFLIGSVAEAVAIHAQCSVEVVRERTGGA
jgi:nucleotide-binding universal stress UspA family protein